MEIKKLAIFCGSSTPKDESLADNIEKFLRELFVERPFDVIYGGANIGVMGKVADIALANNRNVYGVMPEFLKLREVDHKNLSDFETCDSMHVRKERMYQLADAFLILPGGYGTLDEFFEILTWRQLSLHDKPIYLLNTDGFYDGLISHIKLSESGFIGNNDHKLVKIVRSATDLD